MHLIKLALSGFKGVETELEFGRAMVLFGPNDAGKTNLQEALEVSLGNQESPSLRRDPGSRYTQLLGQDDEYVTVEATVELDGLDIAGSRDQVFLLSGLLEWIAPPVD